MAAPSRLTATPAAHGAVRALCAARGGLVMFVQSGGCCAGSVPMCYPVGELLTGPRDLLLGEVEGCPFFIDAALDEALNHPDFVLDVAEGDPEEFSLGAGPGQHFVSLASAGGPAPDHRKGRHWG